jgi:hypothetical protein
MILCQVTLWRIPLISLPGIVIVCLSTHAFQYMLWRLGCMNIDFQTEVRAHISCSCLSGSLGMNLKIERCVSSQERWKLTKFPNYFLKIGWWEPCYVGPNLILVLLTRKTGTTAYSIWACVVSLFRNRCWHFALTSASHFLRPLYHDIRKKQRQALRRQWFAGVRPGVLGGNEPRATPYDN